MKKGSRQGVSKYEMETRVKGRATRARQKDMASGRVSAVDIVKFASSGERNSNGGEEQMDKMITTGRERWRVVAGRVDTRTPR
eukprot:scaffold107976_cov17-Tisochrysis_lutea.AAC.1